MLCTTITISLIQISKGRLMKKIFQYIQRNALSFALLLCLTLYLSFLVFAFTERSYVDTYVCYTTKTGECYHAATCSYLRYGAYKTTVYEAQKKYRQCSRCNPRQECYKTSVKVRKRNYVAPALISIPLSATTYIILIKTKKERSDL